VEGTESARELKTRRKPFRRLQSKCGQAQLLDRGGDRPGHVRQQFGECPALSGSRVEGDRIRVDDSEVVGDASLNCFAETQRQRFARRNADRGAPLKCTGYVD
jgi:hypothetical protein